MKVNVINEYRVEMELGEEELSDFDVSYESLDYGDVNTRRFLRELAENAKELGVEADMSGKVLIEAFRIRGGCRLCFTFLPPRSKDAPSVKQLIKRDKAVFCAVSPDMRLLCRLSSALPEIKESELYYEDNGYVLTVSAAPDALERCAFSAAEFGVRIPSDTALTLARCRENGKVLFMENAVNALKRIKDEKSVRNDFKSEIV